MTLFKMIHKAILDCPNEYNVKGIHRWANSTGLDFGNNENPETSEYINFNADPSSNDVATKVWPNNYRQIGRANIVLENLREAVLQMKPSA